jgi:hypothetical protein
VHGAGAGRGLWSYNQILSCVHALCPQNILPKDVIVHQLDNANEILIVMYHFAQITFQGYEFRRRKFAAEHGILEMGQILFAYLKDLLHPLLIYIIKDEGIIEIVILPRRHTNPPTLHAFL